MFHRCAFLARAVLVALMVFSALPARGQAPDQPSPVWDVFKRVALDPTTYLPALVSYEAHHLDWDSSQVFFQHGYFEQNPEFTISGQADDTPISYSAGNRQITRTALAGLGRSLINNVAVAVVEQAVIRRYPTHRKLARTLGWTERIAFASYLAYSQSVVHFRQWQRNDDLARQLGY